jgi:hypothetical protein
MARTFMSREKGRFAYPEDMNARCTFSTWESLRT